MLSDKVLLLNQNFIPLTVCSARRAVVMVWAGKAEIVESSGRSIRSVSRTFDIPLIVRLLVIVKVAYRFKMRLTKHNIFRRDRSTCQYCGGTRGRMTIDHVIPKSQGGRDTWDNLVCACERCNNRKDDLTLDEAGMRLLRQPRRPTLESFLLADIGSSERVWSAYLTLS